MQRFITPVSRSSIIGAAAGYMACHAVPVRADERPHRSIVNCVAVSPEGTVMATGGWDTRIVLWDTAERKSRQVLSGHRGSVSYLAFADQKHLLSTSWDTQLKLWDLQSNSAVRSFEGHRENVSALAIDGDVIVSGGWDREIIMWEATTGQIIRRISGHREQVLAVAFLRKHGLLASASYDLTVRLWHRDDGREATILEGHGRSVNCLAVSDVTGSLISGATDGEIIVWDVPAGRKGCGFRLMTDLSRRWQSCQAGGSLFLPAAMVFCADGIFRAGEGYRKPLP